MNRVGFILFMQILRSVVASIGVWVITQADAIPNLGFWDIVTIGWGLSIIFSLTALGLESDK